MDTLYPIQLHPRLVEEIIDAMGFDFIDVYSCGITLSRDTWISVAERALGKAIRVERGDYGASDDTVNMSAWAADLRSLSDTIFAYFAAGNGKL